MTKQTPWQKRVAKMWDDAEWNTIREIICRVHPDGAEAIFEFQEWWEKNKDGWLGPHRACGAWLRMAVKKEIRAAMRSVRNRKKASW